MYQQGIISLNAAQKDYVNIIYGNNFVNPPNLILTDIYYGGTDETQEFLEGSVVSRTDNSFNFSLVTAPPNDDYYLAWMASDGLGNTPVTSNGLPVSDLPIFSGTSLPNDTRFPVVIPNGAYKSVAVRWQQIKNLMAASHQHKVEDISDSGSIGRALVQTSTALAAREIIDAAQTGHTHAIDDINGTGTIGVDILEADTAAEVRTLIGVSPIIHTHTASQISDATTLGKNILTSVDPSTARNFLGVPATVHTHAPTDIVAYPVINDLLLAETAGEARSAIAAANVIGWEDSDTLPSSRNLLVSDFGAKFLVGTEITYTIPYGITSLGRICFYVSENDYLTIYPNGGVTVIDSNGSAITTVASLPKGLYILESLGANTFCLTGYLSPFQRGLATATGKDAFVSALGLTIDDLGVNDSLDAVLAATNQRELNAAVNKYDFTEITGGNSSTYLSTNPAGKFFHTALTALNIYSLPFIQDTQSFIISNTGSNDLIVTPASSVTINNSARAVRIPPGDYLEFIKNAANKLTCHYSVLPSSANQFTAYVAVHGNNSTGVVGDITKPYSSVAYALAQLPNTAGSKRSIVVLPGNYTGASIACDVMTPTANTHITFMPGTYVSVITGERLFYQTQGSLFIKGGNFTISADGKRFATLSDSTGADLIEFNADVESIKVLDPAAVAIIQTTNVDVPTSYTKILKAETIECLNGVLAKVQNDALTIKVRNLTTGTAAVSIQTGRVNLSISDGRYNCGNTLLSTDTTAGTLNLSLYNTVVKQGGLEGVSVTLPILYPNAASDTIRVDGFGSSIEGVRPYANTGVVTGNTNLGTLIISNVTIIGSLIIDASKLTLNSVFIKTLLNTTADPDVYYESLYSASEGKTVYILGNVCSTGGKSGTITEVGGILVFNPLFAI